MPSANDLTRFLLLEIPRRFPGARVWRQNVGSGYPRANVQAAITALKRGDLAAALNHLVRCRPVDFGPPPGSPDIGGWLVIDGRAIVLGIEVKVGADKMRPEQLTCQRVYEAAGAIYVVARDLEQAIEEIRAKQ